MKKTVTLLIIAAIMLCGCSRGSTEQPVSSTEAASTAAATEMPETTTAPAQVAETTTEAPEERDPALDLSLKDMFVNLNVAAKNGKYMGEEFPELYDRYMTALKATGREAEWEKLCCTASAILDFAETPAKKIFADYNFWIYDNNVTGDHYSEISKSVYNGIGEEFREKFYTEGCSIGYPALLWMPEEYDEYMSGGYFTNISPEDKKYVRVLLIDESESIISDKNNTNGRNFFFDPMSYDVRGVSESDWFDESVHKEALGSLRNRAKLICNILESSHASRIFKFVATPSDADIILRFDCRNYKQENYSDGANIVTLNYTGFYLTAANNHTGETASVNFEYGDSPESVNIPVSGARYGAIEAPYPIMQGTDKAEQFAKTLATWFAE